jgi:flagellar basal-body rod modification protein FlgD
MLTSTAAPAATTPSTSPAAGAPTGAVSGNTSNTQLAGNFTEFLQLLTTQLQHQDPTSPLDPNQFTQELVQFASVEQQINTNTSLSTMISLQQTQQAASALNFVGATVAVSGTTAQLANGQANWSYSVTQPATAAISITNSSGQVVYTTTQTVQPGQQTFTWNGMNAQGTPWPSGAYTIAINATGANNQNVPVTTAVQGTVTGVDVSTTPPTLTIGGQSYPINQITQVLSSGANTQAAAMSQLTTALNGIGTSVQNGVTAALTAAGL